MKRGITVSILVVTIIIMFTLITTTTIVGVKAIQTASHEEFLSKIQRVSNDVNKYFIDNENLPTTSEIIAKEGLPDSLKAEINKNNDAANNLFVIDISKIRTESVNIGKGSVEDMDVFIVAENTNNVYYLKGINYKGITYHGLVVQEVVKDVVNNIPENWTENVIAMVDGVPIPKGFVASTVAGENTKEEGLVIYEGEETVTNKNINDARRNRNQYVWVPVENFKDFVRQDFNDSGMISNTLGEDYWEVVVDTTTNMPLPTQNMACMTSTTLAEVQAMYESVKEYKGFYIARYEAGLDIGSQKTEDDGIIIRSIHSKMNKAPYIYSRWTLNSSLSEDTNGVVEVARGVYTTTNTNYGAVSTLTYSVQWDRTLMWWIETEAQNGTKDVTITRVEDLEYDVCQYYGVYDTNEMLGATMNEGARASEDYGESYTLITKDYIKDMTSQLLTTGASEETKVNNIYDMAGNAEEWVMEGCMSDARVARGGHFDGDGFPVNNRDYVSPDTAWGASGFRISLYIKK